MSDNEWVAQRDALLGRFDEIFQSSKTPSDTSAELLSIIHSYPTYACAEALSVFANKYVHATPQGVDALVLAIKSLINALSANPIEILREEGKPEPFIGVFCHRFLDILDDYLHEKYDGSKQTTVTPTNTTLSSALFSASIIKLGLFPGNSGVYAFTRQGLQLPKAYREPERDEILAVGVCLQLSVAGAMMMEDDYFVGREESGVVLRAMKGLKKRGVVASSDGMRLLDKTIAIAEGKYSQVLTSEEAWNILFST